MADLALSIGTKISEYLVEPVLIRPLRPIFCFKSIVDDFQKEQKKLILAQVKVKDAVKEAKDNALEIYEHVDKLLEEANAVMEDAQILQNKLEENKSCCLGRGWTCHYRLSKQAWEVTDSMKNLTEIAGSFNQVARPVDLRQHIGLPFSEDFVVSKSADSALREIMKALMKDDVNKVGLYGTGGAGKTTLAKRVFKEAERLRMFDRVVLVTVPRNPDAVISIQGIIADFLNLELKQESKEGRACQLHHRLTNGEKILIILDDVCEELDLATIGIPSFGCCKVLLTTRDLHVCNSMQTQRDIQLGGLSEDEAWDLFKSVAGVGDQLRRVDVAKKVLMFSNGVPKALVYVGRALRGQSHSEWEATLQRLKDHGFKTVMGDLLEETAKLSLRKRRVLNEIKTAKNDSQVIENDVEKWVIDVEMVMEDTENLKGELNQNSILLGAWDDVWSKKATLQRAIVQKLYDESTFDRVAHPAAISQDMGLSLSKDFIPSKSATSAFREIMKALMKDDVNVIGLYGMAGIGKTTLAKQVANEAERLKTFDQVVMVTVSQTPEVRKIQGVIADFLNLVLKKESEEGRASQLSQRLKSEKILIILDDVWNKFDLAGIGIFGDKCKSCKILLTTRCLYVCTSMDSQVNIRLNLLSEDEAWDLFKKKALLPDDSKLNDVAKQVVRECHCLPKSLATAGAALRNKNADEWKEALEKLGVKSILFTERDQNRKTWTSTSLPKFVVLKSKYNSKYLQYIHENVEVHGFVQFSGEDIMSPLVKLEVVKAKSGDGSVHLRCSFNNKFLTRWSERHWWLVAGADHPEEDQSKWSCTLFKPIFVDGQPETLRFMHFQLGHYACLWRAAEPYASCLFGGAPTIDQDECDVFKVLDWDSIMESSSSID